MKEEKEFIEKQLGGELAGRLSGKTLPEIKSIIHKMAGKDKSLYRVMAGMTMSRYGKKILSSSNEGKKKLVIFNALSFVNLMIFAGIIVFLFMKNWWAAAGCAAVYFIATNPLQTGLGYDMAARMIHRAYTMEKGKN